MKIAVFPPVFLLLLMHSAPVAPVIVTTSNSRVEVEENAGTSLSCDFKTEKDRHPRIEWKKKDKDTSFVYFNGSFTDPFVGRARIEGATIKLEKVRLTDAGEYRCEVSASEDEIKLGEASIFLNVLVPPHTPSCQIPSSALTGSVVVLRCEDKQSIPPARYTWYKDKKPVFPPPQGNATYSVSKETGILTFHTVTIADTGLYHCEANNGVGKSKSCVGNRMTIDDLNVSAIVAGIVILCLIIGLCTLGACYAHRHGYFNRHRGSPHAGYGPPSQNVQDFKHTQSFML